MEQIDTLMRYGLFDARVPRYTSYPPANHFATGIGAERQPGWLSNVPDQAEISAYIHIPFCKRLCWFCACRTQGTKTLRPVNDYIKVLLSEINAQRKLLPRDVKLSRLHLGGGTPTILSAELMATLLDVVFTAFDVTDTFEFSVEIDPTDATDEVLQTLLNYKMNRASIGVQDFALEVQAAIGRQQSVDQTMRVVEILRDGDVPSLNLDLLYGLPLQTRKSFRRTLDQVLTIAPDRLALYGYAHVPWMSKRQVMIKDDDLPEAGTRYEFANLANDILTEHGYLPIGIDHFAKPNDGLAKAAVAGTLHRNFQGYTDDNSDVLIGFGASAISKFPQGYVQNAPATSAYVQRVQETGLAGFKGHRMSKKDRLIAEMVNQLMCDFSLDKIALAEHFPKQMGAIHKTVLKLIQDFPDLIDLTPSGLTLRPYARPLVRVIAGRIDQYHTTKEAHSLAI